MFLNFKDTQGYWGTKAVGLGWLSQLSRLSSYLDFRLHTIFKIPENKTKGIDFETLNKICNILRCDTQDLFEFIPD